MSIAVRADHCVSTLISAFNALTLSPALCALLLQPHHAPKDWLGRLIHGSVDWLFRVSTGLFEGSRSAYLSALRHVIRHGAIGLFLYAACSADLAGIPFGAHRFHSHSGQGRPLLLPPASGWSVAGAHQSGQHPRLADDQGHAWVARW